MRVGSSEATGLENIGVMGAWREKGDGRQEHKTYNIITFPTRARASSFFQTILPPNVLLLCRFAFFPHILRHAPRLASLRPLRLPTEAPRPPREELHRPRECRLPTNLPAPPKRWTPYTPIPYPHGAHGAGEV